MGLRYCNFFRERKQTETSYYYIHNYLLEKCRFWATEKMLISSICFCFHSVLKDLRLRVAKDSLFICKEREQYLFFEVGNHNGKLKYWLKFAIWFLCLSFPQEHEKKRDENFGDPLDLDNKIPDNSTAPEQKVQHNTAYGAITNGDPKPPSPDGKLITM